MNAYGRMVQVSSDDAQFELREQHTNEDKERVNTEERRKVELQPLINWLSSEQTQRMFKDLIKQSNQLTDDAIGLALVNHQQQNEKTIVHKLIEAHTLRKVVENYVNIAKQ